MNLPSTDELRDAMERGDEKTRMELRALSRRSLYFYTKTLIGYFFTQSGANYITADVFKERQDFTQNIVVESKRGLIEDPRAHIKSWGCTVPIPGWCAIQRPCVDDPLYGTLDAPGEILRSQNFLQAHPHLKGVDSRLVIVSDSIKRAGKWVATIETQWETNPLIRWVFPEVLWQNSKVRDYGSWNQYECHLRGRQNPALTDGFLRAAGIESKEQGGRAEGIFIEDIVGEQSYKSPPELEKRKDFIKTITSLLENNNYKDPRGGFVLINGNRWCLDDVNSMIHDEFYHYDVWRRRAVRCYVHGAGNCGRWPDEEE